MGGSTRESRRWRLAALAWLVSSTAACTAGAPATSAGAAEVAVTGGGVTVDVVTTNVWSGGFNGAVRVTNNSFPAPITSFQVVFQIGCSISIQGTGWNGTITAPDGNCVRTATSPSWMSPI